MALIRGKLLSETKRMQTIVVASTNPVEVQVITDGFRKMFPQFSFKIISFSADSDVSAQPMSDTETFTGAFNRARNACSIVHNALYWVGVEGGAQTIGEDLSAFAWVVVLSKSLSGKARSGTFLLPPVVSTLVQQGKELEEADDIVFNRTNSKRENGAIGILT
jgi:inosine/xanthosine triphosphatase